MAAVTTRPRRVTGGYRVIVGTSPSASDCAIFGESLNVPIRFTLKVSLRWTPAGPYDPSNPTRTSSRSGARTPVGRVVYPSRLVRVARIGNSWPSERVTPNEPALGMAAGPASPLMMEYLRVA